MRKSLNWNRMNDQWLTGSKATATIPRLGRSLTARVSRIVRHELVSIRAVRSPLLAFARLFMGEEWVAVPWCVSASASRIRDGYGTVWRVQIAFYRPYSPFWGAAGSRLLGFARVCSHYGGEVFYGLRVVVGVRVCPVTSAATRRDVG
jgi:hypothetical protein